MANDLTLILNYLKEKHGFDSSGYHTSMIERWVQQRFTTIKCESYNEYFNYLQNYPDEIDNLLDVLTINVGWFFRDTLTFEYIADRVLPAIAYEKKKAFDSSIRIWSAGCAMGEDPY